MKILFLTGTVAATRALGPAAWGTVSAIISAGFIGMTGVNLGLNPYLSRELAAGQIPADRLIASGGRFRLASSILFAIVAPVAIGATVPGATPLLLALLLTFLLTDSWAKYFFAMLRGLENTRYEVVGGNLEKAIFAGGAVAAFVYTTGRDSLLVVAAAFALGSSVKLLVAVSGARRILRRPILPIWFIGRTIFRAQVLFREFRYLKESSDFLFMALFSTIYFRIDNYMVAAMHGAEQAGLYAAAYRLIEGLLFVPEGIMVVFSPLLVSTLKKHSKLTTARTDSDVQCVVRQVASLQAALVGLLVLGLILEHDWTIRTVYGRAFGPASLILLWLAPAFGFMGLNFLLGGVLSAGYRQRTLLWAALAGVVVNVPLNAVLIPRNGAFGAAIATVVTEGLVTGIMFFELHRQVGVAAVVRPLGRIALWLAALVGLPAVALHPYLPVAARISLEFGTGLLFLGVLVQRDEIPNLWARGKPAVVDP